LNNIDYKAMTAFRISLRYA